MSLIPYTPDPQRYNEIFGSIQGGGNPMVRYRGAAYQNGSGFPQILKSLFARFIKPVLSAAAPHARKAFEAAQPHSREAANSAVSNATARVSEAIAKRLALDQEGQGGPKRRRRTSHPTRRLKRIPPRNIPDFI